MSGTYADNKPGKPSEEIVSVEASRRVLELAVKITPRDIYN